MRFVLFFLMMLLAFQGCFAADNLKVNSDDLQANNEAVKNISKYTFEETMSGKVVKIKKGTELPIILQTPIDTSTTQENDEVAATLNEDLKIDGAVVAKQNSVLYGKVIKAKSASSCMRGGKVKIKFDKLVTTENQIYTISTKAISFVIATEDKLKIIAESVAEIVIVAAYAVLTGGAAAVVLALCMMSSSKGFLPVLTTHGDDAVIPADTPMEVSLNSSLNAMATY